MSVHQVKHGGAKSRAEGGFGVSPAGGSPATPGGRKRWALRAREAAAHTHGAAAPPGSPNMKSYLAQEDPKPESTGEEPARTLLPGHPPVAAGGNTVPPES